MDILRKSVQKKTKNMKNHVKIIFLEVLLKMVNNGHKIFKFRKISKNAHKNRNSAPFLIMMRYLDRARRELSESVLKSEKIIFRN